MARSRADVVIVGGSVGGIRTAQALRSKGYRGTVLVLDEQPHAPYDRPPLSKAFLAGKVGPAEFSLITSAASNEECGFDVRSGVRVTSVDAESRALGLADGTELTYQELVLATGATAMRLPGFDDSVHVLRNLDDAERLRRSMREARSVLVLGAGLIGVEVASAARDLSLAVTMVDVADTPLSRLVTPDVGGRLADIYRSRGVDLRLGTRIAGPVRGTATQRGVVTESGEELHADLVVCAVGASPAVGWLMNCGLPIGSGIRCDEHGRVLDVPHVWSVGDVSEWRDPASGVFSRKEQWTSTVDQASCVAANIAGGGKLESLAGPDYMWSDHFGTKLQLIGHSSGTRASFLERPTAEGRWYAVFSDNDHRATGVFLFGWPRGMGAARRGLSHGASPADLHGQLAAAFASAG